MKVGIFYNSISNPGKFSNKVMLMDNFRQGVLANGDQLTEFRDNALPTNDIDVGFVLGYTLEDNFRNKIITQLRNNNSYRVFVDSNILHYGRPEHEWHRYSLNSVYPTDGIYFFDNIDNEKWNTYSSWHNIQLKPWRTRGDHILILCQRPKGWNLLGNDQETWIHQTIEKIRKHTDRSIMIRMHPGDGSANKQIEKIQKRYGISVLISNKINIKDELNNCWCSVGYNSTPNVVSAIEGVPVYLEDPDNSWAKDICFTDLSQIENPPMPDRSEWINKIANIHWSNDEVKSGKLWAKIKSHISSVR